MIDLQSQMSSLKAFCKVPVDLDRGTGPVRDATWRGTSKDVTLFLGYIHKFYGVTHPSLHHYANADLFARYLSSRICRKDISTPNSVFSAKKIVCWLMQECPDKSAYLGNLLAWLTRLVGLVRQACPRVRKGVGTTRGVPLEEATTLLEVLTLKKAEVEERCAALPRLNAAQARVLHDVALACTLFGWLPTQRGSILMGLLPTWHLGPCPHADCSQPASCQGNGLAVTQHSDRLTLHLPHHKSDKTWGPLQFLLPCDLSQLLRLYLSKGCRVLVHHLGVQHPFMFMDSKGRPFSSDGSFTCYWKNLLARWGLPGRGPHGLRHAFVCLHMQFVGPSLATGAHAGFAYCMGHGHAEWMRTYDCMSMQRAGQQAVDAMPAWRQAILGSRGSGQQPGACAGLAEWQACCSGDESATHSEGGLVESDDSDTSVSGLDEVDIELSDGSS